MTDILYIARKLGRNKIADALNVGATAVSNHIVRGAFPASWFDKIEGLCISAGLECPRSLFAFRKALPDDSAETATNLPGSHPD